MSLGYPTPPHDFPLRRQYLFEVLKSCTPSELMYMSTSIAPRLKRDFLRFLPAQQAIHILGFIDDPRTLTRVAQVSKYWNNLAQDEFVWQRMCIWYGFDDRPTDGMEERKSGKSATLNPVLCLDYNAKPKLSSNYQHFKLSYMTMMNWRHGGQLLRSPVNTPDSGVTSSLAIDNELVVRLANSRIESDTLPSLLYILDGKKPGSSIASVVNAKTTDLMCKLLSGEDYLSGAAKLDHTPDAKNLLDFVLHMIRYRLLPNHQDESVDFHRRARRFMFKIISKTPIMPSSLILMGVNKPAEQDYTAGGGFGRVYKGELKGEAVALKVLYKSDNNALAFCREALTWGSLKHKFVLPFLGIDEHEDGTTFLISPYMEKGTLAQWRKQANPSVSEIEERILEVALGIEYIHSECIVHGDLRGENILLDANLHVQIADFGLARLSDATNTRSGAKNVHFAAPELFECFEDGDDLSVDDSARTRMSDIYAFGCLYYEIHYDSIPFAGWQGLQITALISQGIRPPRLDDPPLKDEAWKLIEWCWARIPAERPAIKVIAEMIMSDPDPLRFLLFILKDWKPGSCIRSAVNASIIDLVCRILAREDYLTVAEKLIQVPDVQNLLDFLLHLLRDRHLSNSDQTIDVNGRARRLMFKLNSKLPVIPPSLIVTGVSMPAERNYVGSGGFGRVFEGILREEVVALKVLYKSDNDVSFCREALMWGSLKHKFVLPFYGIYEVSDGRVPQFFLVSPFMIHGTLAQWRKKFSPPVPEIEQRILEVAQGIEYIHSVGAVHGDLRGENILLDANLRVQIADFGLTRLSDATNTQSGAKHLNFSAPELFGISDNDDINDVPARTQMTDVYAFGCLFYEIYYDSMPYAGKTDLQIFSLHFRGEQPPRLDHPPLSDGGWDVIQRCWGREALKRPRMKDVAKVLSRDPTTEMLPPSNKTRQVVDAGTAHSLL